MPQSFVGLYYHIIFATKYRRLTITREVQPRLYGYIVGIFNGLDSKLLTVGGMPDHIHLLASISRERSVAEVVRVVKSNSSRWMRRTFPQKRSFGWQNGYAAFMVGSKGIDRVRNYIARQEEHHRRKTFRAEAIGHFRRYRVKWDERFFGMEDGGFGYGGSAGS